MATPKVIIDYSDLPEGELDNFAQAVLDKLTGNTNFTFAANELTALQALITDYAAKYEASRNGTKADTLAKNIARKALLDALRATASQVNVQAGGSLVKQESSGFTQARTPSKIGVLPKPDVLKVKTGANSGELLFETSANEDADVYLFYVAQVPAPVTIDSWRVITSNKRKINAGGFTPGKEYEIKCAYKGSEEALIYSDTIRIFSQ